MTAPAAPGGEPPADQTGENTCSACAGTGRAADGSCPTCGGAGVVVEAVGDA